jgi:quercetin dioxygenase-like cupin family protein
MGIVSRGERRPFGPITNDTSGLAITNRQVGGEGVCRWKMLMNGMHLEGAWNTVEYVVIEPGASVGEHVHARTEEIYYIVSGRAVVTTDGIAITCVPGDLITTPIGTSHAIANTTSEAVHFFVVEVFPGTGTAAEPSTRIHVPGRSAAGPDGASADIDLRPYFTGDWHRFRLRELAPGASERALSPTTAEVLHLLDGPGAVTVDGERYDGSAGLSVAVPPGLAREIMNLSPMLPLRVAITEVAVP